MQIHVVRSGDTLYSVAREYQVSAALLGRLNRVGGDGALAVGQTLVVYDGARTHVVQPGETLFSIARREGVTPLSLFQNNFFLGGRTELQVGEELVVSLGGKKRGTLAVNGYAYTFIRPALLAEALPYLTYLTPFTYSFTADGTLIPPEDEPLLQAAAPYGVRCWMHLSTLTQFESFDSVLGGAILRDDAAQARLMDAVAQTIEEKGYGGLDVDFEYLEGTLSGQFAAFIDALRQRLNPSGIPVVVAVAPKTSAFQAGQLYEAHDYALLGRVANAVLLMTYEWGYVYGPPMAVSPLPQVRQVLDYALSEMAAEKIFLGVPTYGYDWPLPYERGVTRAVSLSPMEALRLALRYRADIRYDTTAHSPYFHYTAPDGVVHEVWFEDARSAQAKFRLAGDNGLQGVGLWNLMRSAPQTYLVLNGEYEVEKV